MAETETTQKQASTETAGAETEGMAGGASILDLRPESILQRQRQANISNMSPMQLSNLQNGGMCTAPDPLTVPLTDAEQLQIRRWRSSNPMTVEGTPLTADATANALIVATGIFYARYLANGARLHPTDNPNMTLTREVVGRDPRVQLLIPMVTAKGPIVNWAEVSSDNRMLQIMEQLINTYGFPVNGAAGLVGNLMAESGCQPNRVEGSRPSAPMRARGFDNVTADFSAEDIQNRSRSAGVGPKLPGVGLAQWTTRERREGLFAHEYNGEVLGTDILFNMNAQIDYLVTEMEGSYRNVYNLLRGADVSVNDAADEVVYSFERPGAILTDTTPRQRRPRTDAAVQEVFTERRRHAANALAAYRAAHPEQPAVDSTQRGPQ